MYRLQDYEETQLEEIITLFHDTVHTINSKDYSPSQISVWAPPTDEIDKISWGRVLKESRTMTAYSDEMIAGFCNITSEGYLDRFYVHKDHQRKGVGKLLIYDVFSYCQKNGIREIETYASITSVPFFTAMGFCIIEENTVIRNGISLTNYHMKIDLQKV